MFSAYSRTRPGAPTALTELIAITSTATVSPAATTRAASSGYGQR
jgi:hypothetical protein